MAPQPTHSYYLVNRGRDRKRNQKRRQGPEGRGVGDDEGQEQGARETDEGQDAEGVEGEIEGQGDRAAAGVELRDHTADKGRGGWQTVQEQPVGKAVRYLGVMIAVNRCSKAQSEKVDWEVRKVIAKIGAPRRWRIT